VVGVRPVQDRRGELLFISVTSDRHWARMCDTFGFSDWADDPRLATNQGRIDEREWFLPELHQRLEKLSKADLMALAEEAGIPFAPVARPQDLFDDPQLNQSGSLATTTVPGGGDQLPKIPLRMDHAPDLRLNPPDRRRLARPLPGRGFSGPGSALIQEGI
jgi:crotonobetainyl-CoA:carnitine CoA-transferase CaiB-like acyl-CoA transferase